MNSILDIGIIILILFGGVLGLTRGFTKSLVKAVGFIVVIIVAYFLKNPVSVLMYEYLPFFNIGIFRGIEILNILIYEALAFLLCIGLLSLVLKMLLLATSVFEKILNATIVLGIPSKIAGAIIGLIHHYIIAFIILYVLTLTCFDVDLIKNSQMREKIVNNTPLLSDLVDKSVDIVNEFVDLKNMYDDGSLSENNL